jgi:two-component system cell cycle sensor histidine kinase PleC
MLRHVDIGRYGKQVFVVLLAALVVASILSLAHDYRQHWQETERRLDAMAEAAAEHVRQVVTIVDLTLRSIDEDWNGEAIFVSRPAAELHEVLKRAQALVPGLQGLGIVDADGRLYASATSPNPELVDLSDREFFAVHRDDPQIGLFISRPVIPRPLNEVAIPVSRRIVSRDGSFRGLVAARINAQYFLTYFSKIGADVALLARPDGTMIARLPGIDLVKARPLPMDGGLIQQARGLTHGVLTGVSPVDGVERIIAFRRLSTPDLVIALSFDVAGVNHAWLIRSLPFLGLRLGGITLLCLVALLVQRRARDTAALIAANAAARSSAETAARIAIEGRLLAEQAERRKSEFLAHMSHELRTPLNAILGFSQLIEAETWGPAGHPKYVEYATDIQFSARHLLTVINNVLDLSKVEAGKWELHETRVPLDDQIASVLRLAARRAAEEGVTITLLPGPAGIMVTVDESLLRQILLNLAINAIKFAGADRRVEIGWRRLPAGGLEISVGDHGPGMSAMDVERAIRPFETPHDTAHRQRSDTGLGLPIAKAFTELHGGSLSIDSRLGEGTTVHVRLPAARIAAAPQG